MATWNIDICFVRRRAIYTAPCNRPQFGMIKGRKYPCEVHGLQQVQDGNEADAYFVIELEDGRCTYASIECIQFTKEDEAPC